LVCEPLDRGIGPHGEPGGQWAAVFTQSARHI
jgi:hypothetical protein